VNIRLKRRLTFRWGQPQRRIPIRTGYVERKQGFMIITDIFRRQESRIDSLSATFEPSERDEIDDRKIIDFASARSELKREPPADAGCSQSIRALLKISQAE
jgi:hypothetical protein